MASIIKNTAYLTFGFIGQKVLAFIYFVIIARVIGAQDIGQYTFALTYTTIFAILIDFGISSVLTRQIAKNKEGLQSIINNVLSLKIIIGILVYLLALALAYYIGYDDQTLRLMYISGIIMVIDSFSLSIYACLRGLQNLRYEAFGVLYNQLIIVSVGLIGLTFYSLDLIILMYALLCGTIFNFVYSAYHLKARENLSYRFELAFDVIKRLYKKAFSFGLAGSFTRIYSYVDTLIIERLLGFTAVGLYSAAYKFPFALQFLPHALSASLYPALSNQYINNQDKISKTVSQALFFLLLISIPIAIGGFALSQEIILFAYGNEFFASGQILQYLILGVIFIFLQFPLGAALAAIDRQYINTILIACSMVVNVTLNIILIPLIGILGAAFAFLASHGLLFFMSLFVLNKIFPLNSFYLLKKVSLILISALFMYIGVMYLKDWLNVIFTIIIGAIIYASIILFSGVIGKDERALFLKMNILKRN